jgi:cytochrome P450
MIAQRITISFVPTPIAQRLIFLEWPTETALRFLLTGADVLQQYPPVGLPFTLVNNYGPTECTVVALSGAVTPHQKPAALPPVGRPISNTRIYLLDENLQPVPTGSIGELHIAGAGVGRGYLNDPELTREKFMPNPFDKNPDARLYKTGDLARTLPDGSFEFLGRTDDQIKIRGYRIEPNEVCAALCKHEAIQAGIVVPIKDPSGNHFLAAYIVLKQSADVNAGKLRRHLQSQLPDYMIPNAFIVLDSFPLATNGKVDRAALPTPDSTNSLRNGHTSSGPTRTEEMLMPIVSALLKVEPINPNDNFFLLDGLSKLTPLAQVMVKQMLFLDPPSHSRIRGLAACAFTPARVSALRNHIQELADNLLDKVAPNGRMDVLSDFADPLPAIVTSELFGVSTEFAMQLKTWSAKFAETLGNFQHNPDRIPSMLETIENLTQFFRKAVEEQKRNPCPGLVHSLVRAELEGDRLTEEEIIANCIITLVDGLETTTNLIGNGILTLLRHPEEMRRLRSDPGLIVSAVEELLRYESPSQHTARLAPADVELGGKKIRKRQAVIAVMGAGNRDPERFPDSNRLDLAGQDNRHLAFGWAAHFCFGAPLARIEGQTAISTLLKRFPGIALESAPIVWRENLGLRGLKALHVNLATNC